VLTGVPHNVTVAASEPGVPGSEVWYGSTVRVPVDGAAVNIVGP
jgi:hypothetical protein